MAKYNLDKYVAVTGLPGLFKLAVTRNNGIVVEDIDTGKTKFLSIRKFQFAPLETIGIYTMTDTVEIADIFKTITDQLAENPLPDLSKNSQTDLFKYLESILPDYDRDRVFIGDAKKIVKWYKFLSERNLLVEKSDEEE